MKRKLITDALKVYQDAKIEQAKCCGCIPTTPTLSQSYVDIFKIVSAENDSKGEDLSINTVELIQQQVDTYNKWNSTINDDDDDNRILFATLDFHLKKYKKDKFLRSRLLVLFPSDEPMTVTTEQLTSLSIKKSMLSNVTNEIKTSAAAEAKTPLLPAPQAPTNVRLQRIGKHSPVIEGTTQGEIKVYDNGDVKKSARKVWQAEAGYSIASLSFIPHASLIGVQPGIKDNYIAAYLRSADPNKRDKIVKLSTGTHADNSNLLFLEVLSDFNLSQPVLFTVLPDGAYAVYDNEAECIEIIDGRDKSYETLGDPNEKNKTVGAVYLCRFDASHTKFTALPRGFTGFAAEDFENKGGGGCQMGHQIILQSCDKPDISVCAPVPDYTRYINPNSYITQVLRPRAVLNNALSGLGSQFFGGSSISARRSSDRTTIKTFAVGKVGGAASAVLLEHDHLNGNGSADHKTSAMEMTRK